MTVDEEPLHLPDTISCLAAIPIPTLLLDERRIVIYANPAYCKFLGTEPTALLQRHFFEIHNGCWCTSSLQRSFEHSEFDQTESVLQFELQLEGIGSHNIAIHHRILDHDSQHPMRLVSIFDLNNVSKLEQALRRCEARNQTLLNTAVDAIVIINTRGVIKAFNPAAERLFGYSSDEVLGLNVNVLMPPPYQQEHDNYLRRYLETDERRVIGIGREVVGQRKDGTTFPMELAISEISDGQERQFVGTVRDITVSKRTKQALRDSDARARAILSTAVDAIVIIDETGLIKSLNPAAQRMFGYTYHEMIGENVSLLMPAPYKDEHDSYLAQYLKTGVPRVIGIGREAVGRRRDGSTFPMELSVSEFRQGSHRYFTGIVRDITERKRYEARLQESFNESQRARKRLQSQTIELEFQANELTKAHLAADAANQAKSEFLANMSHEIRTPMTAILGFTELLEGSLADPADRESIEIIRRNGEHLLEIINDILDISKIESGRFEVMHTRCNPVEIVNDVVSLLQIKAEQKGISLIAELIEPLPQVIFSDALRLRQVLLNLVSNGIKFTDAGTVKIKLQHVQMHDHTWNLEIQISDTGIGISEAQMQHLFKPFTQGDTSVTRRYGGTGLGLALSHHLVQLLGGEIDASSVAGAGSCFTIRLPHEPNQPDSLMVKDGTPEQIVPLALPMHVEDAISEPLLKARILLVEDCADVRRYVSFLLVKLGAEVETAIHGQEALSMVFHTLEDTHPFDLIVLDMQMPILDGYNTARQLRAKGFTGPIVALTAHAMSGDREKCLAAGCDDYISKPIDKTELYQTIEWLLANSKPRVMSALDHARS